MAELVGACLMMLGCMLTGSRERMSSVRTLSCTCEQLGQQRM
jgi:hypothetical protein